MRRTIVACFGIGCLTALEIYAMHQGIDGQIFATVITAIGTIIGYVFGRSQNA